VAGDRSGGGDVEGGKSGGKFTLVPATIVI